VEFTLGTGWNDEMVADWVSNTDDGQILISDPCQGYEIRSHSVKPIIPILQYSIIPLHRVTAQPIFTDRVQLPARRPMARREDRDFGVRLNYFFFVSWCLWGYLFRSIRVDTVGFFIYIPRLKAG
jgi:hypothetical protein